MGLFNKMKKFFSCFKYKLDREILREYLQHTINFAVENKLPFCDEFYIADSLDAKDRLHVAILNYDVPGEAVYEIEKSFLYSWIWRRLCLNSMRFRDAPFVTMSVPCLTYNRPQGHSSCQKERPHIITRGICTKIDLGIAKYHFEAGSGHEVK